MKKLLLLLALSFFSIQSFAAGCPDGSEPVKSLSADGTYFVFDCGEEKKLGKPPFLSTYHIDPNLITPQDPSSFNSI